MSNKQNEIFLEQLKETADQYIYQLKRLKKMFDVLDEALEVRQNFINEFNNSELKKIIYDLQNYNSER